MDKVCIVCDAAATRITKHEATGQSAAVCSTAHARKWKRSVRRSSRDDAGDANASVPAPARREDPRQLTFLGGRPVRKR